MTELRYCTTVPVSCNNAAMLAETLSGSILSDMTATSTLCSEQCFYGDEI